MESRPVSTIAVHDYLRMHLCDLYENDCIFDKFECAASADGKQFLTGSYNNNFLLHDSGINQSITIEAQKDPVAPPTSTAKDKGKDKKEKKKEKETFPNVNMMDFGKKALHVSWHPRSECVAVAGLNKLYIYYAGLSSHS